MLCSTRLVVVAGSIAGFVTGRHVFGVLKTLIKLGLGFRLSSIQVWPVYYFKGPLGWRRSSAIYSTPIFLNAIPKTIDGLVWKVAVAWVLSTVLVILLRAYFGYAMWHQLRANSNPFVAIGFGFFIGLFIRSLEQVNPYARKRPITLDVLHTIKSPTAAKRMTATEMLTGALLQPGNLPEDLVEIAAGVPDGSMAHAAGLYFRAIHRSGADKWKDALADYTEAAQILNNPSAPIYHLVRQDAAFVAAFGLRDVQTAIEWLNQVDCKVIARHGSTMSRVATLATLALVEKRWSAIEEHLQSLLELVEEAELSVGLTYVEDFREVYTTLRREADQLGVISGVEPQPS